MEYSPQAVMDYWMRQPWQPSEGYNPDDAFGMYLGNYSGSRLGAQKCPDAQFGDWLFRFYAGGMLYTKIGDWENVKIAYGIGELPPKA